MRTDFDKHIDAVRDHGADSVVKAHRHTHIVPPVFGVECVARRFCAVHRRIVRNARRGRRDRTNPFKEAVLHGVKHATVEGIVEIEEAEENLLRRQLVAQFDQGLFVTCKRDGGRCVDRGKLDFAAGFFLDLQRLLRRNPRRCHAALATRLALRLGSGNDKQNCLAKIERAGNICGGDLADAVPGDGVRRQSRFLQTTP